MSMVFLRKVNRFRDSALWRQEAGLTLVELLVAVAITAVVMTLSIGIFISQYRSYRSGHSMKTALADNQKAISMIKEDLALAGWSVRPELAFFIVDGNATGPDEIYVNDAGFLEIDMHNATKTTDRLIRMVDSDCAACARYSGTSLMDSGDINGDGNNDFKNVPVIVWEDSSGRSFARNTDGSGSLDSAVAAGSKVTPAVRYCLDLGSALTPNCHVASADPSSGLLVLRKQSIDTGGDRQPMAEDVVDIQVVYQDDGNNTYGNSGCSTCQMASFDSSKIRRLDLSVVTRSRERTRPIDDRNSCRPANGNRSGATPGSDECGYEYHVFTTTITPYNRIR